MAGALIVHDDSVISRTAYLLEERKARIDLYRSILRGDPQVAEYQDVNKEAIGQALENEQWLLNDLIEDIEDWLFVRELQDIERKYLMGGEENGSKRT